MTRDDVIKAFDQHTYDLRRDLLEVSDAFDRLKRQTAVLREAVEVDQRRAVMDAETISIQAARIKDLQDQVFALSQTSTTERASQR